MDDNTLATHRIYVFFLCLLIVRFTHTDHPLPCVFGTLSDSILATILATLLDLGCHRASQHLEIAWPMCRIGPNSAIVSKNVSGSQTSGACPTSLRCLRFVVAILFTDSRSHALMPRLLLPFPRRPINFTLRRRRRNPHLFFSRFHEL